MSITKSIENRYDFTAVHYNIRSLAAYKIVAFLLEHCQQQVPTSSLPLSLSPSSSSPIDKMIYLRSVMLDLLDHLDIQLLASTSGALINHVNDNRHLTQQQVVLNMMKMMQMLVISVPLQLHTSNTINNPSSSQVVAIETLHNIFIQTLLQEQQRKESKQNTKDGKKLITKKYPVHWYEDIVQLYEKQQHNNNENTLQAIEEEEQLQSKQYQSQGKQHLNQAIWTSLLSFHSSLQTLAPSNNKEDAINEPDEEEKQSNNPQDDDNSGKDKEKENIPEEIKLLQSIALEKCRYGLHLSFCFPAQVMILDIVIAIIFRVHSYETVFLPMIHQLWMASQVPMQQLIDILYQRMITQYATSLHTTTTATMTKKHQSGTRNTNINVAVISNKSKQQQEVREKLEFYDINSSLLSSSSSSTMVMINRIQSTNAFSVATTTNTDPSSSSSPLTPQKSLSIDRTLYLLPKYWELYTIFMILQPSFVMNKIHSQLLPLLASLFQCYHIQYMLRHDDNNDPKHHYAGEYYTLDHQIAFASLQFLSLLFQHSSSRAMLNEDMLVGMYDYQIVWMWYLLPFCTSMQVSVIVIIIVI